MNTTMDINNKLHNLELANNNFKSIIVNTNNEKFDYLDNWLSKTSILFKRENEGIDKKTFPKFKCGTIIRVDFGINQGAELSKPHYAIVLDKFDNTKNQSITVVPLTSKNGKNCIPLKNLINDEHIKRLNKNLNKLNEEINETSEKKKINQIKKEIEFIKSKIDFYASYKKKTYARINQITTISKNKIFIPQNTYDITGKSVCSKEILKLIFNSVTKKYF